MKNLISTKSRVILSLVVLLVLFGGLIPTLGILNGGKQHAHASSGWQLQELWHTKIDTPSGGGAYPGVSDITYYSGKVFQTYGYQSLYSGGRFAYTVGFDTNTGAKVWQKQAGYPDYPGKKPILAHNKIYLTDSQYWLHVFDATNDQLPELWSGLSSTATLYNDTLLSHSGYGWVGLPATYYSYDTNTDSVNWQKSDTPCDLWPKIEVYNDIVYYIGCDINPSLYQPDYHTIVARKLSDGSLVWSQTVDSAYGQSNILYPISPVPSFNSTLISNGSIFLNASDPTEAVIASYSTDDGSQKWKKTLQNIDLPTGSNVSVGQIIASGSTVYVLVSVYHNENTASNITREYLYALDGSTGNEIWHNSTDLTNVATNSVRSSLMGTLVDGVIYTNYSSYIYAWDAATGNQLLMDNSIASSPDNPSVSTPLVVGDIMYNTRLDINSDTYSLYAYNIIGQQPTPTPSLSVNVTVSTPGGHFISSDPSDNAALPLHIHVAYSDGSPVAGAKVHLSNPNGFLAVFNPVTDSNGNLDAPLPLPPSSLSPQPLTDGDFVSEVIATVNGKDYSSGSLTLYHADSIDYQTRTITQTEADYYSLTLLLEYAARPGIPCPSGMGFCSATKFIDWIAKAASDTNSYSPKANDLVTEQWYKYTAPTLQPTMTPVYLYYKSIERDGSNIYNSTKWTENITQYQNWLRQQPLDSQRITLAAEFASPITVLAVSPTGQRAGFDPTTQKFVFDSPVAISNIGDEPYELLIPGPVQGQYVYQVTGTGNGTYTMTLQSLDGAGNGVPKTSITGVAATGVTDTYLVTYSASPGQPIVVRKIEIDIKPGEDPPAINPNSTGVIPVAILSTPTFDATKVSLASIRFGPTNARPVDKQLDIEDVNGDGRPDVVFHFVTYQTGIKVGNTQACLNGQTTSSVNITGCDAIRTVTS